MMTKNMDTKAKLLTGLACALCALTLTGATGCALESAAAEDTASHELPYTPDPIGVEGLDAALPVADDMADILAELPEGAEIVEDENAPEGTVAVKAADGTVSYVPATSAGAASTGSSAGNAASAPAAHVHNHAGGYDRVVTEAHQIWHEPITETVSGTVCPNMGYCHLVENCEATHYTVTEERVVSPGYYETIPAQYAHVDACSCGYVW